MSTEAELKAISCAIEQLATQIALMRADMIDVTAMLERSTNTATDILNELRAIHRTLER